MSKFDEKITLYQSEMKKLGLKFDADLLTKATKGLGPSIYKSDAETVSASDKKEIETLKKKLGLKRQSEISLCS